MEEGRPLANLYKKFLKPILLNFIEPNNLIFTLLKLGLNMLQDSRNNNDLVLNEFYDSNFHKKITDFKNHFTTFKKLDLNMASFQNSYKKLLQYKITFKGKQSSQSILVYKTLPSVSGNDF